MNFVISKNNSEYRKATVRESNFWNKSFKKEVKLNDRDDKEEWVKRDQAYEKIRESYQQSKITGNNNKKISDYILEFGPFKNALSLGSGFAKFELELVASNKIKSIDIIDFSDFSINRVNDKIKGIVQDINFIHLDKKYDLIICRNILHHIINLEHVMGELNNALSEDGILFIEEYIGENKFQWNSKRKRLARKILKEIPAKKRVSNFKIVNKTLLNYNCPFESIRSEDIPSLLKYHFSKTKEIKYGGVFHLWDLLIDSNQKISSLKKAANMMIKLDTEYSSKKLINQVFLAGIYKKKKVLPPKIRKWTNKEIKQNIGFSYLSMPIIKENIKRIISFLNF